MLLHGHGLVSQAGRWSQVPSGSFTLYDSSRPYRTDIAAPGGAIAAKALIVNFPRLLTQIHAFIQQHLRNPELSPAVTAAAHHISVRLLHKLFHEQGQTVAGWIRQCRLERSQRDLVDPTQASRPVAAVAVRWGFGSTTHFTRAFRAAYGLPPHHYRLTYNPSRSGSGT
jgi:AraC-like DNA-binding protein